MPKSKHSHKKSKAKHRSHCSKSSGGSHKSHHKSKHSKGSKCDKHVNNRPYQPPVEVHEKCIDNLEITKVEVTPVHVDQPSYPPKPADNLGPSDRIFPPQPRPITVDPFTPAPPTPIKGPDNKPVVTPNPHVKAIVDVHDEANDQWWKVVIRQDWSQEDKVVTFDKEDGPDLSSNPLIADINLKIEIPALPIGNITESCYQVGVNFALNIVDWQYVNTCIETFYNYPTGCMKMQDSLDCFDSHWLFSQSFGKVFDWGGWLDCAADYCLNSSLYLEDGLLDEIIKATTDVVETTITDVYDITKGVISTADIHWNTGTCYNTQSCYDGAIGAFGGTDWNMVNDCLIAKCPYPVGCLDPFKSADCYRSHSSYLGGIDWSTWTTCAADTCDTQVQELKLNPIEFPIDIDAGLYPPTYFSCGTSMTFLPNANAVSGCSSLQILNCSEFGTENAVKIALGRDFDCNAFYNCISHTCHAGQMTFWYGS